jgi:alpha-tubulin suppressor-like RCC1 family protein
MDRLVPTYVTAGLESLTAGSNHTCGISGDGVLCWGDNRSGQVGDGTNEGRAQPQQVVGLPSAATQLVAGAVHTCALVTDGSAYCWGQNIRGQLGIGSAENRNQATSVVGGHRFRSIYAGGALTCAITQEGDQYCWGLNQDGQLGDGTRESRSSPVRVGG